MVSGAGRSTGGGSAERWKGLGGVVTAGSACSGRGVKRGKALESGGGEAEERTGRQLCWCG